MRRAARTDANHAEILQAFRDCGFQVFDTSRLGGGFPDCVVHRNTHGVVLVEIKDGAKPPSARKLTPDEDEFAQRFPVDIVTSVDDVLALANKNEAV